MDNKKKAYIAGKIANNPTFKQDFQKVEIKLISEGYLVLNPSILPDGFEIRDYWNICKEMINACNIVYFLPNWIDSKGSHFEMGYCEGINKPYEILLWEEVI